MRCPCCRSTKVTVIDTRKYDTCIIRRRWCHKCNSVFKTIEMNEQAITIAESPIIDSDVKITI